MIVVSPVAGPHPMPTWSDADQPGVVNDAAVEIGEGLDDPVASAEDRAAVVQRDVVRVLPKSTPISGEPQDGSVIVDVAVLPSTITPSCAVDRGAGGVGHETVGAVQFDAHLSRGAWREWCRC